MTVSLSSGVTENPHFLVRDGKTLKYAKIEMPDLSADESALSDLSSKVFIPDTYFIEDMGGQMAGELLPNIKTIEVNEISGHKVASLYGAYDEEHMTYISSTTQYHNDEWGKNVVLYGYEENDPSTAKIMYVGTNYIDIPTDTDTLSTATFKQKQDEPDMKIGLAGTAEASRRVADESLSSQSASLEVLLLEGKKTLKYCNLAPLLSGSCETSVDISSYQLEAEYPLVKSETSSGKDTSWNIAVDGWQSPGNLSSIWF